MQKLGRNAGRYCGETIDVASVLTRIRNAADRTGWHRDFLTLDGGREFLAYRRTGVAGRHRLYLSAGIHGDEPAGPLAVAILLEANQWPETVDLWLCPCLNPSGFQLNRRENADGLDLNRDYRHLATPEVRTHVAWLKEQPDFHLTMCLHEDWEASGFYLYEVNPDRRPSIAQKILDRASLVCPTESGAMVDGWTINEGVIRPDKDPLERPQWPEALFLILNKTRLAYTLEAPSDFALQRRVNVLVAATNAVLDHFRDLSNEP